MERSRNGFSFVRYMVWTCLVLLFLSGTFGCKAVSNFRHVYSDMAMNWHHPEDNFKRKVVVVVRKSPSFVPPAGMETDLAPFFSKAMYAALPRDCKKVLIINSGSIKIPEGFSETDPGAIFSLCQNARQVGCNIVVDCNLISFAAMPHKKSGWFSGWFSKSAPAKQPPGKYKIVADVYAYNTLTGAWIYHKRLTYQYDSAKTAASNMKPGQGAIDAAIAKGMADSTVEGLCSAIGNQEWTGFGIAATADTITINSGADVGIDTGDVLDAWSPGQIVSSVDGAKYWLPGKKTGKVRIFKVSADTATGRVISGKLGGAGSVLLYQGALP